MIPHVLEKSGTTNTTQYTFDTSLNLSYAVGLGSPSPGPGADVHVFLYDASGAPLTNNGLEVCAPCTYSIGGTNLAEAQSPRR